MTTALHVAAASQPNTADWWSVAVNGAIALLTLAAVVIALVVLVRDRAVRNDELARRNTDDAERAELERWEQARHVTAWLEWARPDYRFRLHVFNGSDRPVFDVEIMNIDGLEVRGWRRQVGLVPPGMTVTVEEPMPSSWLAMDSRPLEVAFRDARGQWWEQTRDGVLVDHPSRPYGPDPLFSAADRDAMPPMTWHRGTPEPAQPPA